MDSERFLLHEISWTDVEKFDREKTVFLIPVGSTEQHGPQNPLGTDFLIAEYIARKTAEKLPFVFCLPTLPIGVAPHHRDFPGTLYLSHQTFEKMVKEVIHSLHIHGFRKIVIINGHGGNTNPLTNAITEYNDIHDMLCFLFEWWKDEDLIESVFGFPEGIHAATMETSVVWAVCPDLVIQERFEGLTSAKKWGREVGGLHLTSRTVQFTKTGIAGPLEGFSREKGEKVLETTISKLVESLKEVSEYKDS